MPRRKSIRARLTTALERAEPDRPCRITAIDWPGKFAAIPWVYAEIVRHLALSERVNVVVPPGEDGRVRRILRRAAVDLERVVLWPLPTDRVWLRDSGPIFVVGPNGEVAATD